MLAFMFFISRLLPVLTYELFPADVSFIVMLSTSICMLSAYGDLAAKYQLRGVVILIRLHFSTR